MKENNMNNNQRHRREETLVHYHETRLRVHAEPKAGGSGAHTSSIDVFYKKKRKRKI